MSYEDLHAHSLRLSTLRGILNLLHWDQETHMPPGANACRTDQISLLSELLHKEKISRSYRMRLSQFVHMSTGRLKKKLPRKQAINIREWHYDYEKAAKLSPAFVKEFAETTSAATQVWAIAKRENQYALFEPYLQKIIDLNRKKADIMGFEDHPYDALLESHEPCATTKRLDPLLQGLKTELLHLLAKIPVSKPFPKRNHDPKKQQALGQALFESLPIEPTHTRLDLSSHPFSIAMHPLDSRITTRIVSTDPLSNVFSILHETGHALYEMGFSPEHFGTPLGEPSSLSIHESQSRFWETIIGRSLPFWRFFYPTYKKFFPTDLPLSSFYRSIHRVTPSFIRVEADEVTYNLHIVLRYEIEKALITGKLSTASLPEVWNGKFQELFGLTPPTDAVGCLQDIHWATGAFGYFPTYTLGNLLAAQFFQAFLKDHKDWQERVAKGELLFIREWLREHVHQYGRTYNSDELVKKVTGKPLSEKPFCSYLRQKYI